MNSHGKQSLEFAQRLCPADAREAIQAMNQLNRVSKFGSFGSNHQIEYLSLWSVQSQMEFLQWASDPHFLGLRAARYQSILGDQPFENSPKEGGEEGALKLLKVSTWHREGRDGYAKPSEAKKMENPLTDDWWGIENDRGFSQPQRVSGIHGGNVTPIIWEQIPSQKIMRGRGGMAWDLVHWGAGSYG